MWVIRMVGEGERQEAGPFVPLGKLKSGTYKTSTRLGFGGAEGFAVAVGGVTRAMEDAFDAADVVDGFAVGALAGLLFSIDFHFG